MVFIERCSLDTRLSGVLQVLLCINTVSYHTAKPGAPLEGAPQAPPLNLLSDPAPNLQETRSDYTGQALINTEVALIHGTVSAALYIIRVL